MEDLIIYSGYSVLFIDLILFTYSFFRKKKAKFFFLVYLFFSFIIQISMELCYHLHFDNLWMMNTFVIGQMILLGLFYRSLFKINAQRKFIIYAIGSGLLVILAQLYSDPQQIFKFNLFEITVCSLLVLVFALIHFYNMLTESKSYYYFTIGVIMYMLASTVLMLVGNLTVNLSKELKFLSWRLNAFLITLYYLLILVEWVVSFSKTKKQNI